MNPGEQAIILHKVQLFADQSHGDQKRKYSSDRYIVHPVRVMELCKQYTSELPVLSAALLHDVLEDTPVTKSQMLDFLQTVMTKQEADRTFRFVVELTDVYTHEKFPHLNRRARKEMERNRMSTIGAEAQLVKYADIIDNCHEIVRHDRHFAGLFLRECEALLKVMRSGNKQLYELAMKEVSEGLQALRAKPA